MWIAIAVIGVLLGIGGTGVYIILTTIGEAFKQ